jgi:hypothetical protein
MRQVPRPFRNKRGMDGSTVQFCFWAGSNNSYPSVIAARLLLSLFHPEAQLETSQRFIII